MALFPTLEASDIGPRMNGKSSIGTVGFVEAGHHRDIENRGHDENDKSERWMYVCMWPKVNVCSRKVKDGCMWVGAPTPDLRNDLQDNPLHL